MAVFSQLLKLLPSYQKHHNHEPKHWQPAQGEPHCSEVDDEIFNDWNIIIVIYQTIDYQ
jgi:hypothetical protein